MKTRIAIGGLVVVLLVFNGLIIGKESLRRSGRTVFLALAPVDPRSLMQGDYMRLDYAVTRDLGSIGDRALAAGALIVQLDARGVASFTRIDDGTEPGPSECRLKVRRGRWDRPAVAPDSFMFQEGQGEIFARARFAELRVDGAGNVVLAGLRDEHLKPLP